MATSVASTKLDFDTIKTALKTYLAGKDQFKDYNFEASGINNILDVLAYNTHYNALTANFALNEAFLNTAQLRSSVVAHAATLGYETRSMTASAATVKINLEMGDVAGRPSIITLPAFTSFSAKVGDATYTFNTPVAYTATEDPSIPGNFKFKTSSDSEELTLKEGTLTKKTFLVGDVGERQLYVIPDTTMDTATAIVKVYENAGSSNPIVYTRLSEAITVTKDSTYYQISEAPNGYYELNFGDGISFGKAPSAGNKIEIEYLSVVGEPANGASVFTPQSTLSVTVNGTPQSFNLVSTTTANSNSGADVQSIESIRSNAPIAFAAQQRLVTAEDYKAVILQNYSGIIDAIAWGGEDNLPPKYGCTYVSLLFAANTSEAAKTSIKNQIVNNLSKNLSVISIDTLFSDPVTTYLELGIDFQFDPGLTGTTQTATEASVLNTVQTYIDNNLKKFGGVFRRSNLLSSIDNLSPAILNSRCAVKVQLRLIPALQVATTYTIAFPVSIASPDDVNHVITSTSFIFNNRVCTIKNKLNTQTLQILNSTGAIEIDNIGSYEPLTGVVTLNAFTPVSITSGDNFIKITATPANQATVTPLRQYILDMDTDPTYANGTVDRQTQQTALTTGVGTGVISY